jgi:Ca2+-binding RTX toxin-like protein
MTVTIARILQPSYQAADLTWATLYDQMANTLIYTIFGPDPGGISHPYGQDLGVFDGNSADIGFNFTVQNLTTGGDEIGGIPVFTFTGGTISEIDIYEGSDSSNTVLQFLGLSIDAAVFQAAIDTFRDGHQPVPIGDGLPDRSAFDAIFLNQDYNVAWTGYGSFKFTGGNLNDTIGGGTAGDWLSGGRGIDSISGGNGYDVLNGGAGGDILTGGDGNDFLDGGAGVDNMSGEAGDDRYFVDNAADIVTETTDAGADQVLAAVSYGLAAGQEVETLSTTNSAGTRAINLAGNGLAQEIIGNSGDNSLRGFAGNDRLTGNAGDDNLRGDAGNDRLTGGDGRDLMDGGTNNDTFVFTGRGQSGITTATADTIGDWSSVHDNINMPFAGGAGNYFEHSTSAATIEAAASAAETLAPAGAFYAFLFNGGTDIGYLLADLNKNGVFETGIILTGAGAAADFGLTDIV